MLSHARLLLGSLALAVSILAGCGSRQPFRYVRAEPEYVPPRLELARYGAIGIVEFTGPGAGGATATAEFLAAVHAAQPGTPVLELGALGSGGRIDAALVRELAAREHVAAICVGTLSEAQEMPRLALNAEHGVASASAKRKASLTVRLFDGASGATVWSASSERTIPVMSVDGSVRGVGNLRTRPLEEARSILVRDLVNDVTGDLRPQWITR